MSRDDAFVPRGPRRASTMPARFLAADEDDDPSIFHPARLRGNIAGQQSSGPRPAVNLGEDSYPRIMYYGDPENEPVDHRYQRGRATRPQNQMYQSRKRRKPSFPPATHDYDPSERWFGGDNHSQPSHQSDSEQSRRRSRSSSRSLHRLERIYIRNRRRSRSPNESDLSDDAYDFTLSRPGGSVYSDESTFAELEPKLHPEVYDPTVSEPAVIDEGDAYNGMSVVRSQYVGEGTIGGLQRADLAFVQHSKASRSALYRWIHFPDPDMVFDNFQNAVVKVAGLSDVERFSVSKLLSRVKRRFDKPMQISKNSKARIMAPSILQEEISESNKPKDKQRRPRMATWICMPYFSLERYSGAKAPAKPGAHPLRTLLQYRFPSVHEKRDLQQAVCHLLDNSPGHCYHVAQIWYLVLDQSLLVTCAAAPRSVLEGDTLSVSAVPKPEAPQFEPQRLLVAYGNSVVWAFQLNECKSWPGLISRFTEFWPQRFRLLYKGKVLSPEAWPRVYNLARHAGVNLQLRLELSGIERISNRGVLNSLRTTLDTQTLSPSSQTETKARQEPHNGIEETKPTPTVNVLGPSGLTFVNDEFAVFPWLRYTVNEPKRTINLQQLKQYLSQIDNFLSIDSKGFADDLAYRRARIEEHRAVQSLIEAEARSFISVVEGNMKKEEKKRRDHFILRVDIFNACEAVFQFFLPLQIEGPTVTKFWGAVANLVEPPPNKAGGGRPKAKKAQVGGRELRDICADLEELASKTRLFRELLSQLPDVVQRRITIPDELVKAWLHLVMALVSYEFFESHAERVLRLLDQGMKQVMQRVTENSLLDNSVVLPMEVASLLSFRLIQDLTSSRRDISEVYSEYLRKLEADVEAKPLDRGHQVRMTRLKQEISVIKEVLTRQRSIFCTLGRSNTSSRVREEKQKGMSLLRPQHYLDERRYVPGYGDGYGELKDDVYHARFATNGNYTNIDIDNPNQAKLSATDPGGYRDLLVQDSLDLLDTKIRDFDEMRDKAAELEQWNIQRIDSNKDRQEAAIYAFTVVTIIFLPLSTVAGILGMNTNDIRNMELKQWVFWATAIPLALLIIFLCLVWVGELDTFWRGFTRMWRARERTTENAQGITHLKSPRYAVNLVRGGPSFQTNLDRRLLLEREEEEVQERLKQCRMLEREIQERKRELDLMER